MAARADASDDKSLVITRLIDAPRSLVFKAWTDPKHMIRWLGPKDFVARSPGADLRIGGAYRCTIRSPAGEDHIMVGTFTEVKPPERLAFTFAWEGKDGKPGHQTQIEIDLADEDGKTRMTFRQGAFETVEDRDGHDEGWNESFDRLAVYLSEQ